MLTTLILCLLALAGPSIDAYGASLDYGSVNAEATDLSILELLADGEAHDGSTVRVTGVLQIELEGDQLCLSKEALRYSVTRNCLALGVDPEPLGTTREELTEANGEYVLVEGVFRASDRGHLSLFSGAIREVTRILLWERAQGDRGPSGPATTKQESARTTHPSEHVSILEIALDCAPLDGREVTLIGALSLGFESQALCPTSEFLDADRLSCLWLAVDDTWTAEDLARTQEKLTPGTYVMVDGTVSCEDRGFGDLYGASLHRITWIVVDATGEVLWEAGATGGTGGQRAEPRVRRGG